MAARVPPTVEAQVHQLRQVLGHVLGQRAAAVLALAGAEEAGLHVEPAQAHVLLEVDQGGEPQVQPLAEVAALHEDQAAAVGLCGRSKTVQTVQAVKAEIRISF